MDIRATDIAVITVRMRRDMLKGSKFSADIPEGVYGTRKLVYHIGIGPARYKRCMTRTRTRLYGDHGVRRRCERSFGRGRIEMQNRYLIGAQVTNSQEFFIRRKNG